MAQAISCWPLTSEARVRTWVRPCEISGGQSVIGTVFSPSSSAFPVNIISLWLSILIYLGDEQKACWWPQFRDTNNKNLHNYMQFTLACILILAFKRVCFTCSYKRHVRLNIQIVA
jgi:hypothetical protein